MRDYQAKLTEVQKLISQLEKPDIPLEVAMDTYVKARALLGEMQTDLREAESRMTVNVLGEKGELLPLPERVK